MDDSGLAKEAIRVLFEKQRAGHLRRVGSVLMGVPKCSSFTELVALAGEHHDHPEWSAVVSNLKRCVPRDHTWL